MNTIWIVPIEPIDQRYTAQWYTNIPTDLNELIQERNAPFRVVTIDGEQLSASTTSGAFLDFACTNAYKASQIQAISRNFNDGTVKPGDRFLVTDAWNFVTTAIRYMSDLLNIPVVIHGIWHAGAYDPTDILGSTMRSKPWGSWVKHQEIAWAHACDFNYFATEMHRDKFSRAIFQVPADSTDRNHPCKLIRSGQPHKQIISLFDKYINVPKKNQVIWPHRYNADKQPEIAERIKEDLKPGRTEFVITQKMNLSKADYYQTLAESAVIFSCALHENLGISVMEGVLAGCLPLLPDRCSYAEMYGEFQEFIYPSMWTDDLNSAIKHRASIKYRIDTLINNYDQFLPALQELRTKLIRDYLNALPMYDMLLLPNTTSSMIQTLTRGGKYE